MFCLGRVFQENMEKNMVEKALFTNSFAVMKETKRNEKK